LEELEIGIGKMNEQSGFAVTGALKRPSRKASIGFVGADTSPVVRPQVHGAGASSQIVRDVGHDGGGTRR
jgi:hypothetical protein